MIQVGEIKMDKVMNQVHPFKNKTVKYIFPCVKEYGQEFITRIEQVYKIAIGLGDIITRITNKSYAFEKHLFIALDSTIAAPFFKEFIKWIRDQPMYIDDYVYGNIQKSNIHMVVIRLPDTVNGETISLFKNGTYSKMFGKEAIDKFFNNHPKATKILLKDDGYKLTFAKILKREFGTVVDPEDLTGELDLPPRKDLEIFNSHLDKQTQ